jgi:hypothetical protein
MTKQEIFDKVYRHLLTQNKQCSNERNCLYRKIDEKGNKLMCAAGCLIPDEMYSPSYEAKSWDQLIRVSPMIASTLGLTEYTDFITQLQSIHDCEEVEDWEYRLVALAKVQELTVPTL